MICSGQSGHTEAIQVYYDEATVSYDVLLTEFGSFIDPTQVNGQGNDRGTQYRTGIYYHTPLQRDLAEAWKAEAQKQHKAEIATEIKAAQALFHDHVYNVSFLYS